MLLLAFRSFTLACTSLLNEHRIAYIYNKKYQNEIQHKT